MLLLFLERSNPMSPAKLMQPVYLRGFREVLHGTQGNLVCGMMALSVLLGSWAVCFPGEGGFYFVLFYFFLLAPKMELA